MIQRQPWVSHDFHLGIDPGWSDNILPRVQDTSLRIRHHFQLLSDSNLSNDLEGKWSIKQHIGHLIDLEYLHILRLREFAELRAVLSPADMSNAKTEKADYNTFILDDLLAIFDQMRQEFIEVYTSLADAAHQHQAKHERLGTLMRPVDLLFFAAEHDDHHICSMLKIKERLRNG